jgi:Baseplate J-like protein
MAVLYLDADDEITSAAARIRSTEDERVAVVLPYGSRLATSRINFRLLAREATERGKTIEIVAADASARALAMTAGLTVHPSVAAFESGGEGVATEEIAAGSDAPAGGARTSSRPRGGAVVIVPPTPTPATPPADDAATGVILVPRERREPVPVVGRVRPPVRPGVAAGIAIALVALLALGGILAFTLLPSASIVLSPWSKPIGPLQVQVVADPTVTAADPTTLTVPAQQFTFDLAVNQTFNATGLKVTEAKATGSVTFANFDTGRGVFIPAGTVVRTESRIEFTTNADLTLPRAGVDFFPPFNVHPSTGSVAITASDPGVIGNVGNNTITIVPKGGNRLRVTNPDPTTGGSHTEAAQVTQQDVTNAIATLTAALPAELDTQIAAGATVPSGTTLYPETKVVGTATPTVDAKKLVGKVEDQFDLGVTAQGTVLGVDASPVQGLAEERLRAQVEPGWTLDSGSVAVQLGTPFVIGSQVNFPVTLSAREIRSVNQAALLAEIQGRDVPAARAQLDDFGSADIRLWPDWVTTIPTNSSRVTITLGDPVPEPTPSP